MPAVPTREARVFVRTEDDEDRFLPEGPRAVTLDGRDALLWVNIQTAPDARAGAVHARYFDDGEQGVWNLRGRPGFIAPTDRPGTIFVGMEKEVGLLDLETNEFTPLAAIPDANPRTIVNDGEVVPGGRAVVFGTKDVQFKEPLAGLYVYSLHDNAVSLLAGNQTCSNGKVFVHYGSDLVLFDIDTPTRKVVRYRLDLNRKVAAFDGVALDLAGEPGFPDGMRAGDQGTVIVAFYNPDPVPAGRAVQFDPATGERIAEWTTPGSPRVTCPCLVPRPDGIKLVLTTATEGMPAGLREKCPEAGHLFISDTDLPAIPPQEVVRLGG
jgi:sugar lactone lactonase YvrE